MQTANSSMNRYGWMLLISAAMWIVLMSLLLFMTCYNEFIVAPPPISFSNNLESFAEQTDLPVANASSPPTTTSNSRSTTTTTTLPSECEVVKRQIESAYNEQFQLLLNHFESIRASLNQTAELSRVTSTLVDAEKGMTNMS